MKLKMSADFIPASTAHGCAASKYHALASEGGHVPPQQLEQKAGSLLHI